MTSWRCWCWRRQRWTVWSTAARRRSKAERWGSVRRGATAARGSWERDARMTSLKRYWGEESRRRRSSVERRILGQKQGINNNNTFPLVSGVYQLFICNQNGLHYSKNGKNTATPRFRLAKTKNHREAQSIWCYHHQASLWGWCSQPVGFLAQPSFLGLGRKVRGGGCKCRTSFITQTQGTDSEKQTRETTTRKTH